MKCDFHMHTIFSDGKVWPTTRVDEAWRTGLDAIAITDHVESQHHKGDVSTNRNRSFEIAEPQGRLFDVLVIRGAEITKKLPPGHLNAIFLTDANPVEKPDFRQAIKAAIDQKAFVFWNHPSHEHPQKKSEWFPEHTELYEKGWMHGIEVVNGMTYYPEAHAWCLEKKLTMMCNSDIHEPLTLYGEGKPGDHRPMTLVLVKEKTPEALKEALFARRTLVYMGNMLIGEEPYLRPIYEASVSPVRSGLTLKGKDRALLQIRNRSEISFELEAVGEPAEVSAPKSLTLHRERVSLCEVRAKAPGQTGTKKLSLPYVVKNLLIAPGKGLPVNVEFEAAFTP